MQPHPPTTPPQISRNHMSDVEARELRKHPGAREVGYGWLRIARPEYFPDRVLLVSTSAPVSVAFSHGSADLDQMRASLRASMYASKNPQDTEGQAEQIVGSDENLSPAP